MANLFTATAPFLSLSKPFTKTAPYHQCCASSSNPPEPESSSSSSSPPPPPQPQQKRKKTVETTDWVASSLTRRFGIGAGLAWAGFLAFGVISEQIKTRIEVSQEVANTRFWSSTYILCIFWRTFITNWRSQRKSFGFYIIISYLKLFLLWGLQRCRRRERDCVTQRHKVQCAIN